MEKGKGIYERKGKIRELREVSYAGYS